MRIITFNANGIRSAANKGFFDWLKKQNADVVCLQETKAQEDQLTDPMFRPDGHHCFYRDASTKKGYSGVAIYSRREPDEVRTALGWPAFDDEGRYIEARYGNLSVVSLYVPSGTSGDERQKFKYEVMAWLAEIFAKWLKSGRDYVICGDWNIVRSRNDIKNWTSNQKNTGCLPDERAWLNGLIADACGDGTPAPKTGWVDSFRARQTRHGRVHLVVESRRGTRKQRRLAHRLSNRLAVAEAQGLHHHADAALFRSCADARRIPVTDTLPGAGNTQRRAANAHTCCNHIARIRIRLAGRAVLFDA